MRLRLLIALMALSTVGCRAILGIDDDPPILSGGSGGTASAGSSTASGGSGPGGGGASATGGSGGGVSDPDWARFKIPPDSAPSTNYSVVGANARDKITGLEWERDPPGENVGFAEAKSRCAKLGGGFRLPNRIELETIWDFAAVPNKIDDKVFASLSSFTTEFWTSSAEVQGGPGGRYWTVEFASINANSGPGNASFPQGARCVRVAESHPTPDLHYKKEGKVILDQWTGLSWDSDKPVVQRSEAKSRCSTLQLGAFASGWRLPSTKELLSIWDETQELEPYWDPIFGDRDATNSIYWSGTAEIESPGSSYGVDYGTGGPTGSPLDDTGDVARIRCVHD